jgi:hypothetical protein
MADPKGVSASQTAVNLKCAESAHRRYLNSMKTLTTLRALVPRELLPASPVKVFDPAKKLA